MRTSVYRVAIADDVVCVIHPLTSPRCPLGTAIRGGIRAAVSGARGVDAVEVHLVWEPEWYTGMIDRTAWPLGR